MKVKLCPWVNSELFFLFLKNKITKIKLTSALFFSLLVVVFGGGFFCNKKQNLQGSKSILERKKEVYKIRRKNKK